MARKRIFIDFEIAKRCAIAIIESSKASHVEYPQTDISKSEDDPAFHRRTIAEYNFVLEFLKKAE